MEHLTRIAAIAAGGAFGAVARYLINISPLHAVFGKFPLPTFVINITGSFLIGFLLILFTDKYDVGETMRFAVLVGFLGAFTTFSTFELELWELLREGHYPTALIYLILSITTGFLGVAAGISFAKRI